MCIKKKESICQIRHIAALQEEWDYLPQDTIKNIIGSSNTKESTLYMILNGDTAFLRCGAEI